MMQVGVVRVAVAQGLMPMPVRMRFAHRSIMVMLMMCVMNMKMIMLQSFVNVLVVVPFCQMEIEPQGHQHTGRQVSGSCRKMIANSAPMNGASEK